MSYPSRIWLEEIDKRGYKHYSQLKFGGKYDFDKETAEKYAKMAKKNMKGKIYISEQNPFKLLPRVRWMYEYKES